MAQAVAGTEGARVPGARRLALRRELTEKGIPVEEALQRQIEAIGR
jgi:LDH2 family malate/lactate/ureidoglycolate dehydrogenase